MTPSLPVGIMRSNRRNLSALLDNLIQFADPRPRNPLGEFTQQGEGGADPNAMAVVYKQQQPGIGMPKLAGAALAGGALGGIGAAGGKDAYENLKKLASKLSRKR